MSILQKKILIVDDENSIRELLQILLESNGFTNIKQASDGETALEIIKEWSPSVILLDLMLPKLDGLSICRTIRSTPKIADIPIIMITAKSEESDIVLGLELGANDYITKPFSNKIVLARIRNQLRNYKKDEKIYYYKNLIVDISQRKVFLNKYELELTYSEFEILALFIQNQGRVFTRNQLLSKIKHDLYYEVTERTIDVQIVNLRKKLKEFGRNIVTIRGIGYCIKTLEEE